MWFLITAEHSYLNFDTSDDFDVEQKNKRAQVL